MLEALSQIPFVIIQIVITRTQVGSCIHLDFRHELCETSLGRWPPAQFVLFIVTYATAQFDSCTPLDLLATHLGVVSPAQFGSCVRPGLFGEPSWGGVTGTIWCVCEDRREKTQQICKIQGFQHQYIPGPFVEQEELGLENWSRTGQYFIIKK